MQFYLRGEGSFFFNCPFNKSGTSRIHGHLINVFFFIGTKKAALQKIVLELKKRNFHYFNLVQFFPPKHGPGVR